MYKKEDLENIVYINTKLIVLQALKESYTLEINSSNQQEIKNFRSSVLLSEARFILETLVPLMFFLVECEKGRIKLPPENIKHIKQMIAELTSFYDWAIKEIKLKNHRHALLELEKNWDKEIE